MKAYGVSCDRQIAVFFAVSNYKLDIRTIQIVNLNIFYTNWFIHMELH